MAEGDDEKIAEEVLLMRLLSGFHSDEKGREVTKYFEEGEPDEQRAREILAARVREGIRGFVGELLALAIDPQTPSTWPGMHPTRRVQFRALSRGQSSNWARDLAIVDFIRRELRKSDSGKLDAAYHAAAEHYGLSRSSIISIWNEHPLSEGYRLARQ